MGDLNRDTLTDLERKGWDALCTSTGSRFYGDLMAPESLMILANGMVLDRDAVVASLLKAPAWDRFEMADVRVVPLGLQAAALVYRATAFRADEPPFEALMTSIYTLVDGAPRLALYQQTTVTH